jgi:hypothetical protein
MRGSRDVKFIIYQVLYIFVVCVIALKGANIDLTEVLSKDNVVKKQYADSLKAYIDSILALGLVPEINFDTAKKIENLDQILRELNQAKAELNLKRDFISPVGVVKLSQNQKIIDVTEEQKQQEKEPELGAKVTIREKFTQYLSYSIRNPYNGTLVISADGRTLASIPQGSSGSFQLQGEKSITFSVNGSSDTKPIEKKPPPQVNMTRLAPSGGDVSLRSIQNQVGYRIQISDIAPEQLKVNVSGPVKVTQSGSGTFDVTLSFLSSKSAFDTYTEGKDSPYVVSFTVSVVDAAGTRISRQGQFTFGDW